MNFWRSDQKIHVVLEYDPEVKSYSNYCTALPGCAGAEDAEEDAWKNINEAKSLYLEPVQIRLGPN